jgi:nitrogen fixation NifU-like protein
MADQLYREIILDHYRNPRNKGILDPADFSHEDTNPLCGDEVRIDLRVADGRVETVRFSGRGCAISMAAASVLTEMVEGKTLAEVRSIGRDDLLAEIEAPIGPARMKCATLGLKVLKAGLSGAGQGDEDL